MVTQLNGVLGHLRRMLVREAELSDGELLEAFSARQDESAFEALVQRHGPMVLGVCQRLLHDPNDAEDAFQATFLVLVRKADSIRPPDLVGHWLYGVAYRTAMKARSLAARRRARELQVRTMPSHEPLHEPLLEDRWRELRPVLDQELNRLPAKYRAPVVLCDLEGKSRREVAQSLGLPEGTVSSRLARARQLLSRRLARQGITLSAGTLAGTLAHGWASAALPTPLVTSTVQAALGWAGNTAAAGAVSAPAAALAEGVLQTMFLSKSKLVAALLLVIGLLGTGAVVGTQQVLGEPPDVPVFSALAAVPGADLAASDQEGEQPDRGKAPAEKEGDRRPEAEKPEPRKAPAEKDGDRRPAEAERKPDPGKRPEDRREGPSLMGVVKSIQAGKQITVSVRAEGQESEQSFALSADARIVAGSREAARAEDVKPGMRVVLLLSPDRKTVVGIREVRGEQARLNAVFNSLDAAKGTIVLTVLGPRDGDMTQATYQLAKDVQVFANRQPCQLADLKPGVRVTVSLSDDKKTVLRIDEFRRDREQE
jgi:RNA polymerase sigma factor (sigma-70 family)